ncbi:unnamed protein product [Rhizoctonia solani]|uniref:Endonuclease 3 n=1 Tax=Rhizoctonia solani TaxID=456999 RepID=A0A8H3CNF7_9AGAM|nr:unnamed protein product [Rhizoctonia solani]
MRVSLTLGLAALASPALGWGMFGHQITATIAQIYLLPSTREAICSILPGTYKCNLAGVASWPDEIKQDSSYKNFATLHFVNAEGDKPPNQCVFGEKGWKNDHNILNGIVDMARDVTSTNNSPVDRDHALRFLVHFLGDIHQPYHLTGEGNGANDVMVRWKKDSRTRLHAVWDDLLISRQVLFVNSSEYTSVLPTDSSSHTSFSEANRNQHIEAALRGLNYDPYIRYILLEGVYKNWAEETKKWTACPATSEMDLGAGAQPVLVDTSEFKDPADLPTVCPLHWATETHPLLCTFIWPRNLTEDLSERYADNVRKEMIVEKQLAMGGVRLASVLNGLFGSAEEKAQYGIVPLFA